MLDPQRDRSLFMEGLRPPAGYQLDSAIGTTFTLDLMSLLTVPLAFTFFDWEDEDGRPTTDPLALLEALRRHVDRLSIFCQAGRIAVPRQYQPLIGCLEDSVMEVRPGNRNGVFHPKIWALRFVAPEKPVQYRLIVASRNLTFDRSWDTMLVLEGELVDRKNAFALNHPLGDFIAALPTLAARPSEAVRVRCEMFQSEIRRVSFRPPQDLEVTAFWPLGIPGHGQWPFRGPFDRLLVISPFITENCLTRLTGETANRTIITRPEGAGGLSPGFYGQGTHVFVLNDQARIGPAENDAAVDEGEELLSGLHAKTYVAEVKKDVRLWTGSANATDAAFRNNVEFLVELSGHRNTCGIDAIVEGSSEGGNLASMILEYQRSENLMPVDELQQALEKCLEETRRTVADVGLSIQVVSLDNGQFAKELNGTEGLPGFDSRIQVECRPITLDESASVQLAQGRGIRFTPVSFEALTSFFVFSISAADQGKKSKVSFVLNLPAEGMPADRRQGILRTLLRSKSEVLRFLLLLLAGDGIQAAGWSNAEKALCETAAGGIGAGFGLPLFESLVRTLHNDPERLEHVARTVQDLAATEEGRALLPDDFEAIWGPIRQAWEEMRR